MKTIGTVAVVSGFVLIILLGYGFSNEPQDTVESTPKNYPGDAVFLNYCIDNNIIRGEEALKCLEVARKGITELRGLASLEPELEDLTREQLQERLDASMKRLEEINRLLDYLKKVAVG